MSEHFPHRKELPNNKFAYVAELTYGRARINLAHVDDPYYVITGW